jgi:AdoMet-dependent heme synthase
MKNTDRTGNVFPGNNSPGITGNKECRSGDETVLTTGKPRIISWNVTLKCPLNCAHCYADAGEEEIPGVLSTQEAFGVIDQICEAGNPVVILSGGEPLMREDIFEIARYGTDHGLRMALGTSGYLLSWKTAGMLKDAGIRSVAVSIDSANPDVHDRFRGRPGAWGRAVRALRWCREAGIGTRINMTIQDYDIALVDDVVNLGTGLGVNDYQVFFPVPTGRAHASTGGTPSEYEKLIGKILTRYRSSPVHIRPTCAPQFVRIADQLGIGDDARGRGCIAGIRYCRIYANGDVTPCPYLPVTAGNVRETPFSQIWHESEVFAALRDPGSLTGKCGRCGYKGACGGCRARAYGIADAARDMCGGLIRPTHSAGEFCGPDPSCIYEPGVTVP